MKTLWVAFVLTACASCSDLPKPAHVDQKDAPYQEPARLQYQSEGLSRRAEIVKHAADRTDDGLLRLRLVLRNHTDHDVVVEVKVTFTDADGFMLEETNWEPIVLGRRDDTAFSKVSLGSRVADYRVALRDPKRFSAE